MNIRSCEERSNDGKTADQGGRSHGQKNRKGEKSSHEKRNATREPRKARKVESKKIGEDDGRAQETQRAGDSQESTKSFRKCRENATSEKHEQGADKQAKTQFREILRRAFPCERKCSSNNVIGPMSKAHL
jgi:hypothetical protein